MQPLGEEKDTYFERKIAKNAKKKNAMNLYN